MCLKSEVEMACWWRISLDARVSTWRPRGYASVHAIATVPPLVWKMERITYASSTSQPSRSGVRSRSQPKVSQPPMRIPLIQCRAGDVPPKDVNQPEGTSSRSSHQSGPDPSTAALPCRPKRTNAALDSKASHNATSRLQARQGQARERAF